MTKKMVQCVPNFSEGIRSHVVTAIADAMASAGTAHVIDYSSDIDHNRSVVTILGEPQAVRAAVFAGAKVAVEQIDIRAHHGEHPRIGIIDVVPVIPVTGCTMDDCIELSKEIGKDLAEKLRIPVYFYELSAQHGRKTNLAEIRKGGFESLRASGLTGDREPDLGPHEIHPTAGATVVGARGPLIAYNVNLKSSDISAAKSIARKIRDIRDSGSGMAGVKAIGVNLASRGIVQVSTNITQPDLTSVYEVYSLIAQESEMLGIEVAESEMIGVLREDALLRAFSEAIKLPTLHQARVIDNWLPRKS